jgi:uncharacterized protein (DUF427 family)
MAVPHHWSPPDRVAPGPGQESVWDYPRPPRVAPDRRTVRIEHAGVTIATSERAIRVLETAGPPCWYLPPEDVRTDLLLPSGHRTYCEWKGAADHFDLEIDGRRAARVAWSYAEPSAGYEPIARYLAFYAGRVDACLVDGERVVPQPGRYYGGWITHEIVGPFKGESGTEDW